MSTADAIRGFLAPLLPFDYEWQFGGWTDTSGAKVKRFAVLKPVGGQPAELVRRPQFTLTLIGRGGGDHVAIGEHAETCVQAMRAGSGATVFLQPSEPVFIPTADGRPMHEIAISAITT